MKSGGVSFRRVVFPLLVMGVLLTAGGLALSEVAPPANRTAVEIRGERERSEAFRSNFVYLTDTGESLTGRRLTVGDGRILGVTLQELEPGPEEPIRHVDAEDAVWEEGRGWTFRNGFIREIHPDGTEMTFQFGSALFPEIEERPEELVETFRDEDEMTYSELTAFGNRLERSGGDVGRTFTKRAQRFAIPAAAFVIILFGAPLATSSKRGGAAFGVGLSLATTILYIMLLRVCGALGYAGALDPQVAAWLPNGVFLAAGLVLMQRVRT